MNVRILAIGAVVFFVCFGVGILLYSHASSMTASEEIAYEGEFYDASAISFVVAGIGGYVALYGLVVKPRTSVPSSGSACDSIGPGAMVVLGFGLFPLSGFILYLGWWLMEAGGIGQPLSWFTLFAGFALGVIGLWLTIVGIVKGRE